MADTGLVPRAPRPAASPGGLEKAAILLLTLGPEAAAAVFRHLNEQEIRQVSSAIGRLRTIPREQAAAVHEEAWRRLTDRESLLVDGEQFARQMITAALSAGDGGQRAQAMRDIERATQTGGDYLAASLEPLAPAVVAELLASEHPQVIALILATLPPRQAAQVLAALPEVLQPDIVQRISDLQSVSEDVLAEVGDVLQGRLAGLSRAREGPPIGGAKVAADIMNVLDQAAGERVFAQLDTEAPELAETIRQLMFTFEDLIRLDNRGMQTVLKEVAREDLMLALKTASPAMRDKIFSNLSQRAAEILKEDMATMGPARLKDVEKAQADIVGVVRRLEADQKITVSGGGGDVLI